MQTVSVKHKKWKGKSLPRKILVIRLQATGDVVACLPVIQDLRNRMPADTRIDLLTRVETESIPRNFQLFDHIYALKGKRSTRKQLFWLLLLIPSLFKTRYDVVLDLQNNKLSKIARIALQPTSWTEFDKQSSNHACKRYQMTVAAAGFSESGMNFNYTFKNESLGIEKLMQAGWNGSDPLVVINPAGAFITRNWEPEKYIAYCKLYLQRINANAKFLVLGLPKIAEKADMFKQQLGDQIINLVGETTPAEAFNILQKISFMLSEDSALWHMAYLSGIPTVGLLGSTRNDWTDPLLPHTFCFHSADLECGNCMSATCKIGTILCLQRVAPEMAIEKTIYLLNNVS